jgi:hypothetical protein
MVTNSGVPSALSSIYSTQQVNQPVLLYQGIVDIQVDSQKVASGKSNIYLNWLPSPGTKVEIGKAILDISAKDLKDRTWSDKVQLWLVDSEVSADAYLNQVSHLPDADAENFWRIDIECSLDEATWSKADGTLEYVLGHLVNFPRLLGDWISHSQSNGINEASSRAVLKTENWKITIDGVINISDITKDLEKSGGYAITSLVKIERPTHNSSVTVGDMKEIIDALYFFFSFAVGHYSPVILPVGFDSSDTQIWYEWERWLIPQWEQTTSWFSGEENWDSLAQVFPGFMKIWNDSDSIWHESIRRSIVWYVESNRSAPDPSGRIILVQSALELLSWTYFVGTKKKTKKEFSRLGDTCKKIKAFLNALDIPASFPNTSEDLPHPREFIESRKKNWQQNEEEQNLENYLHLKAFVKVRNDIVHPEQLSGVILSPSNSEYESSFWLRVEALNLGLWYLELSLLSLFEYQGNYINRLKSGKLEAVPWAEVISK